MILLLPIDGAIRPSQRANESGRNSSCLPAIRCLDFDSSDTTAESGKTLCLVERDEDVRVVVFVHARLDDARDLEPLDVRYHGARDGIHLRTARRKQRDAVSNDSVEPGCEQIAKHRTAPLTIRACKAKVAVSRMRSDSRNVGHAPRLRNQPDHVRATGIIVTRAHQRFGQHKGSGSHYAWLL